MKDEPPLTLGLTVPGTGNKDAAGQPFKIFRCPTCREYINTSMTECRFCGAHVDQAVVARARVQQRVDNVCRLADSKWKLLALPVVFWAGAIFIYANRNWIPASLLGWLLTPPFLLAFFIGMWLRIRRIDAGYPNLERAQRVVSVSFWAWMVTFPGPAIILFIARPDLLGVIGKMVSWWLTHRFAPYPY